MGFIEKKIDMGREPGISASSNLNLTTGAEGGLDNEDTAGTERGLISNTLCFGTFSACDGREYKF